MVRLNGKLKKITIKTCFKEVTGADLLSIKKHTPREVLAALSNFEPAQLAALSTEDVLGLYELVAFIDDLSDAAGALPLDITLPEVDVAAGPFERLELAKNKAREIKEPYQLLVELVRIYYGEDFLANPAPDCLALGAMIFEDLAAFIDRFKDLGDHEDPTEDEEEAGLAALHSFGPYGMVEAIAAKYHVRPFDVFQWTAEEVYLELTYQQAKSRYQDNLRAIEKRKGGGPKKNN
jgi:hypothetical protein